MTEKAITNTTHRIKYNDGNRIKNTETIRLPIALELLLPKMQNKIDNILIHCPFLCDPLEVMSEIRICNYQLNKCIKYFMKTKHLRYLYSQQQME